MNKKEINYFVSSEVGFSYMEFQPEDVQPYYDIWDDGSITFYIKQKYDEYMYGLFRIKREKIFGYHERYIYIEKSEIPERVNCKGEENG